MKMQCMITGQTISTKLWELLGVPLSWNYAVELRLINAKTNNDVYNNPKKYIKELRIIRKLNERRK